MVKANVPKPFYDGAEGAASVARRHCGLGGQVHRGSRVVTSIRASAVMGRKDDDPDAYLGSPGPSRQLGHATIP